MKRGTAAKVILGKDTLMDVPAGIVHGTDVILGGKAGLLNDFGGLVLSNNLMLGKKVSRGTITTITVRGQSPLVLPDAIAGSLQAVKAFGGTEQNGTPTPDAPVDIVSNNGVLKVSPNLYNATANPIEQGAISSATGNSSYSDTRVRTNGYIPCKPNTTYRISCVINNYTAGASRGIYIFEYSDSEYIGSNGWNNTQSCSFTTGANTTRLRFVFASSATGDITPSDISNVQLELGSTATTYMPYGTIYTDGTVETINVHSKNLFDKDDITTTTVSDVTLSVAADGTITANGTSSNPNYSQFVFPLSNPISEGTYTVSLYNSDTLANGSLVGLAINTTVGGRGVSLTSANSTKTITVGSGEICNNIIIRIAGTANNFKFKIQIEKGSTPTAYQPYYVGGTATAEMLLKVGDYQDEQEILSGVVTRNVGVLVFDGSESYSIVNNTFRAALTGLPKNNKVICNYFDGDVSPSVTTSNQPDLTVKGNVSNNNTVYFKYAAKTTIADFQQWLADRYAAGAPVIVVYPLDEPTTESVAGQTLQVTDGDNVLEITQASLDNLELEATYKSLVQLTIQEVEDANLNNNVEVTIS